MHRLHCTMHTFLVLQTASFSNHSTCRLIYLLPICSVADLLSGNMQANLCVRIASKPLLGTRALPPCPSLAARCSGCAVSRTPECNQLKDQSRGAAVGNRQMSSSPVGVPLKQLRCRQLGNPLQQQAALQEVGCCLVKLQQVRAAPQHCLRVGHAAGRHVAQVAPPHGRGAAERLITDGWPKPCTVESKHGA